MVQGYEGKAWHLMQPTLGIMQIGICTLCGMPIAEGDEYETWQSQYMDDNFLRDVTVCVKCVKKFAPTGKEKKAEPAKEAPTANEVTDLKIEINNLIWRYGDGKLTLEQADEMSHKILNLILGGK